MDFRTFLCRLTAITSSVLLMPGNSAATSLQAASQQSSPLVAEAPKIPNDQLDSLVAPIALYPDPLLAQVLAASTYPLEIIQLQQWLGRNKDLKDKALTDAVQEQDWDPSVQALAAMPDLVQRLADDIKWTTDLGNAFLAQQSDMMDAVQRMRMKARDSGNLKSTEQQRVETKVVETKTVVVIEPANPQVVYVPTYNPVVVYGPPVYPYPPIYYPPPGYYAAGIAISFGVGWAMGAAWGGGWGWGCGWGGYNKVTINNNNTFIRNTNINRGTQLPAAGNGNWQHNPRHRGGTPYPNRTMANQYGGTARGDRMATRQANARQNQGQIGNRQQSASRPGQGQAVGSQIGAGNRAVGGPSNVPANRAARSSTDMAANRGGNASGSVGANRATGASGGDRIGNRSVSPSTTSSLQGSAFSGASGGRTGSSALASGQRGASSMGARATGGRRR